MLENITGDVTTQIDLYGKAVGLLTPKQQALALATQNLTTTEVVAVMRHNEVAEAEIAEALSSTHLINKKKELSIALAKETLTQALDNEEKAKAIMQSAGIVASDNAETVSKKQVSVATLEAKLAEEGLSASQIKLITTQMGLGTSTIALSNYFKGLTASTWASVKAIGAFLVTNPVGWCILAAGAIGTVIGLVDLFTVSLKEQKKMTEELQEEYKQTSSDLSDVESKLSDVKDRINELNKLKGLTFVEQEELNNLKSTNDLLEKQAELLKQKQEFESKKVRESIEEEYRKDSLKDVSANDIDYYLYQNLMDIQHRMSNGESVTQEEIDYYNQFADQIDVVKERIVDDTLAISDYIDRMIESGADESDPFLIELKEKFEEIDKILNPATYKTRDFENIIDKNQFKSAINEINELTKSGQLSLEKLQNEFPNLVEAFNEAGITAEEAVSQFYSAINPDGKEYGIPSVTIDVTRLKEDLSKAKEEIEDIFKNTNIFDKAIESLNKGEAIDFDAVMSMVEVDSSLAGKFVQTADGYTIALENLSEARQNYIANTQKALQLSIDGAKTAIQTAENNINELKAKRDAVNPASDITKWKAYDDAIRSEEKNIGELNQIVDENTLILGEMTKSVSNAELSVKSLSETLETASKKQSALKSAMEDMNENGYISASTYATLVELGGNFANCLEVQNGRLVLNIEKFKELEKQEYLNVIAANELRIAELQLAADSIKSDPTGYLTKILNGKINDLKEQNALYNTLVDEIENTKPSSSSGGSTKDETPQSILDFETELARRQHEIKMGRMEEDEAYFNWLEKAYGEAYKGLTGYQDDIYKYEEMVYDGRQKLAEEFYNEQKKYHDNRVEELEDTISKIENNKITNLVTQEDIDNLKQFNEEMQETYGLGNVDLTKRPKVDSKAMRKAGYDVEDGETATVFSSTQFLWQGDEKNGKYVAVHYTPILPDGTVLDEDTLTKYLYDKLESSEDILKADADNLGIVLKVDTDLNISDKDIQSLDAGTPTKHIQEVIKATDDWDIKLHDIQETWLNMMETFQQKSKSFTPAEKFDTIRTVYSDLIAENERRINEIVQVGIEGHEDEVKELEKQIEEYADKLQDVFKDEIDYEIDYIESLQDKYNDFIDSRIDRYEDEKKAIEDKYDTEIKSIDDTINALKDKNDATSKAIELKKAEQDLENAKQRTRMVYGADGSIGYAQDTDKIQEAQQKVDDIKLDMLLDSLEKQKEAKEAEKDAALSKYDTMIADLEAQKKSQDEFFEKTLEKLNNENNPQPTEGIDSVIDKTYDDPSEAKEVKQGLKDVENAVKDGTEQTKDNDVTKADTKTDGNTVKSDNKVTPTDTKQVTVSDNEDKLNKLDLEKILKGAGFKESVAKSLTFEKLSQILGFSNTSPNTSIINQPDVNRWITQLPKKEINNNSQPVNMTFGDININNPVGDAKQLAQEVKGEIFKEAMMQIPNDAMRIIYKN